MLTRLHVREKEKPETARRRFDGQLSVRTWATPGKDFIALKQVDPTKPKTPWWWNQAEADQTTQVFMDMARAKGMVE